MRGKHMDACVSACCCATVISGDKMTIMTWSAGSPVCDDESDERPAAAAGAAHQQHTGMDTLAINVNVRGDAVSQSWPLARRSLI